MRVLHAAKWAGMAVAMAVFASGCIVVRDVPTDVTMGDGQGGPVLIRVASEPCIEVLTEPQGAMVSIRRTTDLPPGVKSIDQIDPWRTFAAKGTTPYAGTLKHGKWDVKVELPGYAPVQWVLDIDRREAQKYSFKLTPLDGPTQ